MRSCRVPAPGSAQTCPPPPGCTCQYVAVKSNQYGSCLDIPVRRDAGGEPRHHAAALTGDAGYGVRQVCAQAGELTNIRDTMVCRITTNQVEYVSDEYHLMLLQSISPAWNCHLSVSDEVFTFSPILLPFKVTKAQRAEFILQWLLNINSSECIRQFSFWHWLSHLKSEIFINLSKQTVKIQLSNC